MKETGGQTQEQSSAGEVGLGSFPSSTGSCFFWTLTELIWGGRVALLIGVASICFALSSPLNPPWLTLSLCIATMDALK